MEAGIEAVVEVESDGHTWLMHERPDLTEEQQQLAAYADQAAAMQASWSAEQVAADVEAGVDLGGMFYPEELDAVVGELAAESIGDNGDGSEPEMATTLAERFLVPPFSVLDARQGYWQERKRAWLALGIRGELGRGDNALGESEGVNERHSRGTGPYAKGSTLGAIPPNERASIARSGNYANRGLARCFGQDLMRGEHTVGKPHGSTPPHGPSDRRAVDGTLEYQESWGTSIFDPVLCELAYRWFCPPGGKILDPFAGGSVRGIVATKLGREYTGIELRPEQVEANRKQWEEIGRGQEEGAVPVPISTKWARHLFACSPEYIRSVCHGSCCEGSDKILVSLLPEEQERHEAAGFAVAQGLLQPDPKTGKCPHKRADGLCAVHGSDMKPFGCIASPFTLNAGGTLIIRNRYSRMRCHGSGQPAYRTFRASLDLLFGEDEATRICDALDAGDEDITAQMTRANYDALRYLDGLKHGVVGHEAGMVEWIVGNSRDVETLAPGEYDLVFSCPPYYDLEVYSDREGELSAAATYETFLTDYRAIVAASAGMLKEDRFACFVVGDIRDKGGHYRNFVSDTIAAFRDAGCELYNEAILVTALGSLPIRAGKQFSAGRKLGKTHQNVLVFIKGDWRKATEACGPVEVGDIEEETPLPAQRIEVE